MALAATWAAAVLALLCLAALAALVALRIGQDRAERRREGVRAPVWRLVMLTATGEDDEVVAVQRQLEQLDRAQVRSVEADAFALLPKLRGGARERLTDLLQRWGSADEAVRLAASRSAVRRCRGLHRLGVLGDPRHVGTVRTRLADRDRAVRRTALQAAGSFLDDDLVREAVALAADEPGLRRDLLATLDRIGPAAGPAVRGVLAQAVEDLAADPDDEAALRRATYCAEALGLVDDAGAGPVLVDVIGRTTLPSLAVACAEALGRLGSPAGLPALAAAVGDRHEEVRRGAARALGMVGGLRAAEALAPVLQDPDVEVARAAAQALARCGPAGDDALAASDAPVAREVRALTALGRPRGAGAVAP